MKAPFSIEHREVTPASPSLQVKVDVAVLLGSGGLVPNAGAGATLSTWYGEAVPLNVAASELPTMSAIPVTVERFNCSDTAVPDAGVLVPVDAVTVQVAPEPAMPVTDGVPVIPPPCCSEKFPLATPVTGSLNVTVQLTELALVSAVAAVRAIEETVGACVSKVYVWPTTGVEPPRAFPAAS